MACSERTLIKIGAGVALAGVTVLQAILLWYSISLLLHSPAPRTTSGAPQASSTPHGFELPAPLQQKAARR